MSSGWKEKIYPHLPIFMQNIACSMHGRNQRKLRYGGEFHELLRWLEQSQWWPETTIQQYQQDQLRKIIGHAYNTVPYYRRVFDKLKLKPDDIKTTDDLRKIPVLTKEGGKHRIAAVWNRR